MWPKTAWMSSDRTASRANYPCITCTSADLISRAPNAQGHCAVTGSLGKWRYCHFLGQKQVWLLDGIIKVMSIFGTKDRQVCYSKYLDSLSIKLVVGFYCYDGKS